MKFSYFPHPLDPSVSYPLVVATLQGSLGAIELKCLVDSGADYEIEIFIAGHSYKTQAQFLEPSHLIVNGERVLREIPPLLGRKNTFSNFKIIFDEASRELELIPYQK